MRPLWILQPVLLLVRIEMWAGRSESWPLTLTDLVNVGGMLTGRQVLDVRLIVTPELLLSSLTVEVRTLYPFAAFGSTVTGLPAAWSAAPETRLTMATAIADRRLRPHFLVCSTSRCS